MVLGIGDLLSQRLKRAKSMEYFSHSFQPTWKLTLILRVLTLIVGLLGYVSFFLGLYVMTASWEGLALKFHYTVGFLFIFLGVLYILFEVMWNNILLIPTHVNHLVNNSFWSKRDYMLLLYAVGAGLGVLLNFLIIQHTARTRNSLQNVLEELNNSNAGSCSVPFVSAEEDISSIFNDLFFAITPDVTPAGGMEHFWSTVAEVCPSPGLSVANCRKMSPYQITSCAAHSLTCYSNKFSCRLDVYYTPVDVASGKYSLFDEQVGHNMACPYTQCREGMLVYVIEKLSTCEGLANFMLVVFAGILVADLLYTKQGQFCLNLFDKGGFSRMVQGWFDPKKDCSRVIPMSESIGDVGVSSKQSAAAVVESTTWPVDRVSPPNIGSNPYNVVTVQPLVGVLAPANSTHIANAGLTQQVSGSVASNTSILTPHSNLTEDYRVIVGAELKKVNSCNNASTFAANAPVSRASSDGTQNSQSGGVDIIQDYRMIVNAQLKRNSSKNGSRTLFDESPPLNAVMERNTSNGSTVSNISGGSAMTGCRTAGNIALERKSSNKDGSLAGLSETATSSAKQNLECWTAEYRAAIDAELRKNAQMGSSESSAGQGSAVERPKLSHKGSHSKLSLVEAAGPPMRRLSSKDKNRTLTSVSGGRQVLDTSEASLPT